MELPFNEAGVSVTRTALSVAGQVFPLRDIEDVQVVTGRRNRVVPIVLCLIGVALAAVGGFYGSGAGLVCGVMTFVVGLIAWYTQDVTHRLVVVTGGEPREALTSLDRTFVERVEQIVRLAMASRGEAAAPREA
jgi:membrane-bound ClpP family serine protease